MTKEPWTQGKTFGVGGLIQIGYAEGTDLLLVLSHSGRGLFDCITATKLARDFDDSYESFDDTTLLVDGFDVIEGARIKTAGLHGGKLNTKAGDGWEIIERKVDEGFRSIFLISPDGSERFLEDDRVVDIRAYGFSQTGKSFVFATSSDLTIFSRTN